MTVKLVSPAEVVRLITSGGFKSQLHLGALMLAEIRLFIALPRKSVPRRTRRLVR